MKIDLDISKYLWGLAFVGLIFILLDSYYGYNTLEGIEETKANCNQNDAMSRCPGIDGMLCTEIECENKNKCLCPTKEEICKKNCPCPSCPSDQGPEYGEKYNFYLVKNNEVVDGNFEEFKNIITHYNKPDPILPITQEKIDQPDKLITKLNSPIKIIIEENTGTTRKFIINKIIDIGMAGGPDDYHQRFSIVNENIKYQDLLYAITRGKDNELTNILSQVRYDLINPSLSWIGRGGAYRFAAQIAGKVKNFSYNWKEFNEEFNASGLWSQGIKSIRVTNMS